MINDACRKTLQVYVQWYGKATDRLFLYIANLLVKLCYIFDENAKKNKLRQFKGRISVDFNNIKKNN